MADPTYYVPSAAIHSFLMFAPFLAMWEKKGMVIQGVFLWATGPLAASYISPNLMEQASIWCFFSIAQISVMLFLIRETLIVHWGRPASLLSSGVSAEKGKKNSSFDEPTIVVKPLKANGHSKVGMANGHHSKSRSD